MKRRTFALINEEARGYVLDLINNAELRYPYLHVDIYTNKRRSNQINALYWVWMAQLSDHTGYSSEEMSALMASEFIGLRVVEIGDKKTVYPARTSLLTSYEFVEYMEKVQAWSACELDVNLMWPEEYRAHSRKG